MLCGTLSTSASFPIQPESVFRPFFSPMFFLHPLRTTFIAAAHHHDGAKHPEETTTSSSFRPAIILPGLGNNSKDYASLASNLTARGVPTVVAQVSRPDWLRNASGLLDRKYWTGQLKPRPVLDWYLERIENAIATAKAFAQGYHRVSLVGHSAGGWLARVYMSEFGTEDIARLLTLGTPHLPPPKGIPGVIDQTRGLLDYVETVCPGSFFAPEVKYVCVAGRYLKGDTFFRAPNRKVITTGIGTVTNADADETVSTSEQGNVTANNGAIILNEQVKVAPRSFQTRIVGQGYKQVCGRADVWGDGVVPEMSAYLEGAINIALHGVYHSPVGANELERPWYGSSGPLEQWVHHLLE